MAKQRKDQKKPKKGSEKPKKGSGEADCEPASAEAGSTKVIGRILNLESEMNQRKWQSKERIRKTKERIWSS